MRLRTWWGVDVQRVALHAFNGPLLRTSTSSLNFGYCVPSSSFSLEEEEEEKEKDKEEEEEEDHISTISSTVSRTFMVTNVGAIQSNCMIQMPLDSSLHGCYTVKPTFAVLEPGGVQHFVVKFSPKQQQKQKQKQKQKKQQKQQRRQQSSREEQIGGEDRRYMGTLNVVGTGSETYSVELDGMSGSWLRLSTDTLDVGKIKMLGLCVYRQISLRNPSNVRTLPVTLLPSDTSLFSILPDHQDKEDEWSDSMLDGGEGGALHARPPLPWTVLVPPGTTKIIKIAFVASSLGDINEIIRVVAPCSVPTEIRVIGFVGKRVEIPYATCQDIFVPLKNIWGDAKHRQKKSDQKSDQSDLLLPIINRSNSTPCEFQIRLGSRGSSGSSGGSSGADSVFQLSVDRRSEHAETVLQARALNGEVDESGRNQGSGGIMSIANHGDFGKKLILRETDRLFLKPGGHLVLNVDVVVRHKSSSSSKISRSSSSSTTASTTAMAALGHYRVPLYIECLPSPGRGQEERIKSEKEGRQMIVVDCCGPWYLSAIDEEVALRNMNHLHATRGFLDSVDSQRASETAEIASMVVTDVLREWLKKTKENECVFRVVKPSLNHKWDLDRDDEKDEKDKKDGNDEHNNRDENDTTSVTRTTIKTSISDQDMPLVNMLSPPKCTLYLRRFSKMPSSTMIEMVIRNQSQHEQIYHIVVNRPLVYSGGDADGLVESGGEIRLFISADASNNTKCPPSPIGGVTDTGVYICDAMFVCRAFLPIRVVYVDDMGSDVRRKPGDVAKIAAPEQLAQSLLSICHASVFPPSYHAVKKTSKTLNSSSSSVVEIGNKRRSTPFLEFGTTCSVGETVGHTFMLANRSGESLKWQASLVQVSRSGRVADDGNESAEEEYALEIKKTAGTRSSDSSSDSSDNSSNNSSRKRRLEGTLDAFGVIRLRASVRGGKMSPSTTHLVVQYQKENDDGNGSEHESIVILHHPLHSTVQYPLLRDIPLSLPPLLCRTPAGVVHFGDVQCGKRRLESMTVSSTTLPIDDIVSVSVTSTKSNKKLMPQDVPWSVVSESMFTVGTDNSTQSSKSKNNKQSKTGTSTRSRSRSDNSDNSSNDDSSDDNDDTPPYEKISSAEFYGDYIGYTLRGKAAYRNVGGLERSVIRHMQMGHYYSVLDHCKLYNFLTVYCFY